MARNRFDVDENLETPFSIKHLLRAGTYIGRHKKKMILSLVFSAISAAVGLIGPLLVQRGINVSVPNKDYRELAILAACMLASIIISLLFAIARSRYMIQVGQEIIYDIRKDLFQHLQKLPFQFYDDRPHGKILTRVINYVNSVSDALSNGIINFVLEIFNLILIAIFMLICDVKLSLVVMAGIPLLLVVIFLVKPAQRRAWQDVSNKSSNLNAYLHESLDGMKITQAFTREEENGEIYDRLNQNCRRTWMKAQYTSNLIWVSVENISTWVVGAMYLVGLCTLGPSMQIGTIIALASYAWRFWQPMLSLSNLYNTFINAVAYLERIFEMMDEPITVDDAPGATELPPITGGVEFRNVVFSYDGSVNVLENFNLNITPGESVALVGPTGAGKTTVVNLLSRFYNLTGGQLLLDGHDIAGVTLHSLRSQMGIMLQDSFIFSGTIMDNIRYGRLDATDEEVIAAAKTVCAHEFISQMEQGYQTQVNERGSRLSQGQKQLVAFARTLLSDPKILVLDEATSSIDAKTEKLVQQGLQALLKGRTSFIIAHRLSTIKNCDRILYIADKGIGEMGTHQELLEKRGKYYHLYTAQVED
ncbi:ABC transporter ATP-binding protein [Acutalibacter sp. 1XD8-33]|uniref:ABC transporter ATP-binding protein n=1 Tax=Acutalibacter sp. 1XD8-33 TaxID=2320081 RepID=UPI000EA2F3C3|nr:ABC transporter ATP-binding protein [Acutalibacter sp. 1XD8-33]RKJ40547.1 ABC transporter ATP-binding protein [Acutalibacter sp. 1XD8-33]